MTPFPVLMNQIGKILTSRSALLYMDNLKRNFPTIFQNPMTNLTYRVEGTSFGDAHYFENSKSHFQLFQIEIPILFKISSSLQIFAL